MKKIQAMVKLEVVKRQTISGRKKDQEQTMLLKPRMECVFPSMVERTVKQKPGIDGVLLSKTVSLEQVKILLRELGQEDVSDIKVDLAEGRWQESGTKALSSLAGRWQSVSLSRRG